MNFLGAIRAEAVQILRHFQIEWDHSIDTPLSAELFPSHKPFIQNKVPGSFFFFIPT